MKKIGILTFSRAINFGAQLQALALYRYLKKETKQNVEIIGFETKEDRCLYSISPFYGGVRMVIKRFVSIFNRMNQIHAFEKFDKKYLNIPDYFTNENLLKEVFSKYDLIVCGSDQIWNNVLTGNISAYYAEPSAKNTRKVAYAASFGTDELNEYQRHCIETYLPTFDAISVREDNGSKYIFDVIKQRVDVVVDPVFLLDKNEWESIIDGITPMNENYILFYSLQYNNELINLTEKISLQEGLQIIVVHPLGEKQKIRGKQLYGVDPITFVSLVANATYVATNSFHATAFATIFDKKLIYFANTKSTGRVGTLMKLLDVDCSKNIISMENVEKKILLNKIEESKHFLEKNIY